MAVWECPRGDFSVVVQPDGRGADLKIAHLLEHLVFDRTDVDVAPLPFLPRAKAG